jgi:hypothetical protein
LIPCVFFLLFLEHPLEEAARSVWPPAKVISLWSRAVESIKNRRKGKGRAGSRSIPQQRRVRATPGQQLRLPVAPILSLTNSGVKGAGSRSSALQRVRAEVERGPRRLFHALRPERWRLAKRRPSARVRGSGLAVKAAPTAPRWSGRVACAMLCSAAPGRSSQQQRVRSEVHR